MSDYTITTDFGAKDSLPSGNAAKIIKGSEFTTEFTNIKTAIATKANTVSPTFTGNTALDGATTFGANGTSTFNGTVNFTKDVTFDTNTLFVDVSENRVGIGNVAPATALDVTGVITTDGLTSSAGIDITGTVTASGLTVDTNTLHVDATNNRVGIGTTSITDKLTVYGGIKAIQSDSVNTSAIALDFDSDIARVRSTVNGTGTQRPLGFFIGGSENMRIDSSGNVGIGTTSPDTQLHVKDGDFRVEHTRPRIYLTDTNNNSDYSIINNNGDFSIYDDTNTAYRMYINSSGNVGIGTTDPQKKLHIQDGDVRIESAFPRLYLTDSDSNSDYSIVNNNGKFSIYDDTNTTYRMAIDSTGNVGIGTNNPDSKLHVQSGGEAIRVNTANENTHMSFGGTRAKFGYARIGAFDLACIQGSTGKGIVFCTNNETFGSGEKARIDVSGNVMVGTTDSNAFNGGFTAKTGAVPYINVGHASSVAGGNYYAAFRHGTNTIGTITQNGTTGINYNTSSDERLKENITDSTDAGSKVDSIQIRQFDWKADGSHQDYGVIAQELVTVAPEAVHQPEDSEDMMGVDYSKLVPMLIKEVQSLRSRVAELENV